MLLSHLCGLFSQVDGLDYASGMDLIILRLAADMVGCCEDCLCQSLFYLSNGLTCLPNFLDLGVVSTVVLECTSRYLAERHALLGHLDLLWSAVYVQRRGSGLYRGQVCGRMNLEMDLEKVDGLRHLFPAWSREHRWKQYATTCVEAA